MSQLSEQQILARARASSLDNVKNLNFWGSDLNDISVLRQMPNVEVLSLSVNSITSLKDFAFCPRLRELYLRKNCINDISEIGCLKNLPKLRVLWLSDNPCTNTQHYRMTVLRNLPKLTKLDTIVVEEAEITEASKLGQEIPIPDDIPVHGDFTATTEKVDIAMENKPPTQAGNANPESTQVNLVDETNKLRAELGLKPLSLGAASTTTAMKTTNIPKQEPVTASSKSLSNSRNQNILSAVLTLVKELDRESLETLGQEVDQRIKDLDEAEDISPPADAQVEEKEALKD